MRLSRIVEQQNRQFLDDIDDFEPEASEPLSNDDKLMNSIWGLVNTDTKNRRPKGETIRKIQKYFPQFDYKYLDKIVDKVSDRAFDLAMKKREEGNY